MYMYVICMDSHKLLCVCKCCSNVRTMKSSQTKVCACAGTAAKPLMNISFWLETVFIIIWTEYKKNYYLLHTTHGRAGPCL